MIQQTVVEILHLEGGTPPVLFLVTDKWKSETAKRFISITDQ